MEMQTTTSDDADFSIIGEEKNSKAVFESIYYVMTVQGIAIKELSDKELREITSRGRTYDFWNSPEENIYSLSDGQSL